MKNLTRRGWMAVSAFAAVMVCSAQDFQAGLPWDDMKLNPRTKVKLNFSGSNVESIIRFYSTATGIAFIKDPTLTGGLSISTPKPVSLSDALSMLSASLELKGFTIQRNSSFLVIKAKPKSTSNSNAGPGGLSGGFPMGAMPDGMMGGPGGSPGGGRSTPELRTYLLKYASATSVAKTLNDAFGVASSSQNSGGFGGGGFGFGGPGGGFPGAQGGQQGSQTGQPGGFGQQAFGARGNTGNTSTTTATLKASADEYSNTVLVNASAALQSQVADLLKKLDIDVKTPLSTQIYPLKFAAADELTSAVQNILTANTPKGKGASSSTSSTNSSPFPFGGQTSSSSSSSTSTVTAIARSNSLVVTTTEANQLLIAPLIKDMDHESISADATAVVPLANAKAKDIASLLQQAFGSRSGSSVTRSSTSSNSSTSSSNSNTRSNGTNTGALGSISNPLAQELDTKNLYVQLKDPNAMEGELATTVAVQQGFPGFGQQNSGSNSSSSKSSTTVSRDAQGRVVNTTDLIGKVTIVADPNTNSLLVVGDPDAVARVQKILEQLDKIPQQVVIETMIVEANLDSQNKFGLEWTFTQNKAFGNSGTTGTVGSNFGVQSSTTASTGLSYALTGGNLSAYMNAFKTDSKFQVLSTPRIFTSNNTQATINISQSLPYITSQRQDTSGNYTYNYSFQDVGIVLTVTPQISPAGTVTLDVTQTANELQGYTSFNAPIINKREATTTVSVEDGKTVILGGIMRKSITATTKKIPILGDLPVLGNLFKSSDRTDSKTELLVFLTPKIVRGPEDAKAATEKAKKELSPELQKKIGG